jgi:NAD(P)-dependent dehydrogenase (short-subunit alcohol dehydrogenase family)
MGTRLAGKVAVITGGTSGIGLASARLFAAEGAGVVLAARDRVRGQAVANELCDAGGAVRFVACDVTDGAQVAQLVAQTMALFGRLDVLFNHAGLNRPARVAELAEAEWDLLLAANARSVYLGCHYAIPLMLERGGAIINTAGTFGLQPAPQQAAYSAAKAAVIQLTRQVALDYGPQGIRANCICPGFIDTPATAGVDATTRAAVVAGQPLRRLGQPADVARAALFLASDEASFITGAVLPVDGGQLLT